MKYTVYTDTYSYVCRKYFKYFYGNDRSKKYDLVYWESLIKDTEIWQSTSVLTCTCEGQGVEWVGA